LLMTVYLVLMQVFNSRWSPDGFPACRCMTPSSNFGLLARFASCLIVVFPKANVIQKKPAAPDALYVLLQSSSA